MPRFSIIAVDYDQHVPRDGMRRGMLSIANQTFTDYELLMCHDGPKGVPYSEEIPAWYGLIPQVHCLPERANDWGHSCRDYLMRRASGEYFLHFNIDNLLYPQCLEKIDAKLKEVTEKIVVFAIWHRKLRMPNFTGVPVKHGNTDCLQVVAHRDIWRDVGYWHNKIGSSDGVIYEDMCKRFPFTTINEVLAENY